MSLESIIFYINLKLVPRKSAQSLRSTIDFGGEFLQWLERMLTFLNQHAQVTIIFYSDPIPDSHLFTIHASCETRCAIVVNYLPDSHSHPH